MSYKIIQIIPISRSMSSVYYDDGYDEEIKQSVVCLALIEFEDGSRKIKPMDISSDNGEIEVLSKNLRRIEII